MRPRLCLLILSAAAVLSCGNNRKAHAPAEQAGVGAAAVEGPSILDHLPTSGEPFMLTGQPLTSERGIMEAFYPEGPDDFIHEGTPVSRTFFLPEGGVADDALARNVKVRYNLAAVMNRVVHAYECFERMSTMADDGDEETATTRKDTLEWVRATVPAIPQSVLASALPDGKPRSSAAALLAAYARFDGDDGPGSDLSEAFTNLAETFHDLPQCASDEMLETFQDGFWEWYDKSRHVPEIDGIVAMNLRDYEGEQPDSTQVENLRKVVLCEKDIDRRTVLALELVKFDRREGALLLGDILESGLYTRYLLEAWISWRANVQMEHSPSSFTVIANNYFDMLRVRCMDTIVRHCQREEDPNALCLLENLIQDEVLHRMASIAGNESFNTCMLLSYGMFIHPRLLPEEEE